MSTLPINFFYEDDLDNYGQFSNFFRSEIEVDIPAELGIDGKKVEGSALVAKKVKLPTAEHLFQALKFSHGGGRSSFKVVIEEATAEGAKKVAGERKTRVRND